MPGACMASACNIRHLLSDLNKNGILAHVEWQFMVLLVSEDPHIQSHRFCISAWCLIQTSNSMSMSFGRHNILSCALLNSKAIYLSRFPQRPFMNVLRLPSCVHEKLKSDNPTTWFSHVAYFDAMHMHSTRLQFVIPGMCGKCEARSGLYHA